MNVMTELPRKTCGKVHALPFPVTPRSVVGEMTRSFEVSTRTNIGVKGKTEFLPPVTGVLKHLTGSSVKVGTHEKRGIHTKGTELPQVRIPDEMCLHTRNGERSIGCRCSI